MATIAIDLGGTKVYGAVCDDNGRTIFEQKELLQQRSGHDVGSLICELMLSLLTRADAASVPILGIGVCVPGIAKPDGCVWAPNIPGWDNYPLRDQLAALLPPGTPVVIESDRSCSILGEMWKGAAQGAESAIFVAVGTGIGVGIVANGQIISGSAGIAGAAGWMALQPPFRQEYAPVGNFEYFASGNGIAARARQAVAESPNYSGPLSQIPIENITAHEVFQAYSIGDPIAHRVINKAVDFWGMASANLVSLLNPQKIIWGGGIFGPAIPLIPQIYQKALLWAQPIAIRQVEFAPTALQGRAALLGTAALPIIARNGGKLP